MTGERASLRMIDRADKEILKLSRADKGLVWEFQRKFRKNPNDPPLQLKQLKGNSRLWSARVGKDYRALLLHIENSEYLLISVQHRREVYDDLDRYAYQINKVSGGIEVIDLNTVGDSALRRAGAVTPQQYSTPAPSGLFAAFTDTQLLDLGVAAPLLPAIAKLATEDELLTLADNVPQLTADVLLALYDGKTYEEVLDQITRPIAEADVDTDDYVAAVARPTTAVASDDAVLQAILAESFARWQVFLHPTQRKLVSRNYSGPARVSGGPGTGKTIVALHRVHHLATEVSTAPHSILLTTFNRNLAANLRALLVDLAGTEIADRVDIVNIDRLAHRVVSEVETKRSRRIIFDERILAEWKALCLEIHDQRFRPEFLNDEWVQVILGQALTSRTEYFRARRPGRGQLSRDGRDHLWGLVERFTERLDDLGVWTMHQVAAAAARSELDRAERVRGARESGSESDPAVRLGYRYRHIVVDEAQDLSPAHWTMLRAMVAPSDNDMFLVGDTHQRIYRNYVTLSSLGINIRGRSSRLTMGYRTTRQILHTATEILTGESYDDLDGGTDTLTGYRSLLSGAEPTFVGASTPQEERGVILAQVRAWGDLTDGTTAVCVPTLELVTQVIEHLISEGIAAVEIGRDGPAIPGGVHVGTMHRFKGLEYQRMIIAGVSDGLVPRAEIRNEQDRDPKRYNQERAQARSLLFVAATRARDSLAFTWHGRPSEFLAPILPQEVDTAAPDLDETLS